MSVNRRSHGPGWMRYAAAIALVAVGAVGTAERAPVRTQAKPDPDDVAEGMRLYRTKADCQTCHGWAADGRKMDTQMPDGANLRTTRLNRAAIVYAIRCGRPGRGMPAFDRQAYVDAARCNNTTHADLKKNDLSLPDPPSYLQPREIEMITDFLFEKVIGKGPMDRAACIEYWGDDVDVCSELPKQGG